MRILYYILKSLIGTLLRRGDIKRTDVYRGFKLYFSISNTADNKVITTGVGGG